MSIRLTLKEQEELVNKNLRLVHHLVGKLGVAPSDYDDIVSIGTIGLIKAAASFDTSKGYKFATYAGRCINNEIFMHFRKANKDVNIASLEDILNTDKDGNELTLIELLEDPDSNFVEELGEREGVIKLISIILNLLEPRERLIMLYKMAGITQPVIAKKLGISQSYVSRLKEKLRGKVSEYITTTQQFKEVYTMAIVGDSYKISFFSKDVKNFNQIFGAFLKNLTSTEGLPDFKVICTKERIIIQVPAHPESFSFIAQIIQQIDDYSVIFVSDKDEETVEKHISQKSKSDESDNSINESKSNLDAKEEKIPEVEAIEMSETEVSTEPVGVEKKKIISDNLSTSLEVDKGALTNNNSSVGRGTQISQVREYMLSKATFTTKELRKQFPDVSAVTINNALMQAKNKGLITSIGRGEWETKKD